MHKDMHSLASAVGFISTIVIKFTMLDNFTYCTY